MAHHKRGKPNNSSRASCYLCKYYKKVEFKGVLKVKTRREQIAIIGEREQRKALKDYG